MIIFKRFSLYLLVAILSMYPFLSGNSQSNAHSFGIIKWKNKDGSKDVKCNLRFESKDTTLVKGIHFKSYKIILEDRSDPGHKLSIPAIIGFWGFKPSFLKDIDIFNSVRVPIEPEISIYSILFHFLDKNQDNLANKLALNKIKFVFGSNLTNNRININFNPGDSLANKFIILMWNTEDELVKEPPVTYEKYQCLWYMDLLHTHLGNKDFTIPEHSSFTENSERIKVTPKDLKQFSLNPDKRILNSIKEIQSVSFLSCNSRISVHFYDSRRRTGSAEFRLRTSRIPIRIIESQFSRRSNQEDNEYSRLTPFITKNISFFYNNIKLCTDSSGYILIPDMFQNKESISVKTEFDRFTIEDYKWIKNSPSSDEIHVIINFPKKSLILSIKDKESGKQLDGCNLHIDFSRNIINEIIPSRYRIDNKLFSVTDIKYRITLTHGGYSTYFGSISQQDFADTVKIYLMPMPGYNFLYVNKTLLSEIKGLSSLVENKVNEITGKKESFLLYINNGNDPIMTSDPSSVKTTLRKANQIISEDESNELEKNEILNLLPLDSLNSTMVVHFCFFLDIGKYHLKKDMIEDIQNSLTSGVLRRNVFIEVLSNEVIPSSEKIQGVQYQKIAQN